MTNFLFLDVDGVFVLDNGLSSSSVSNIKKLISLVPNLVVVLTSTRRADDRQFEQIRKTLGVCTLDRVPVLHKSSR